MTKLAFGLPAILLLAAATTHVGAQDAALMRPSAYQIGCVDFSAEYMGCLNFASPLDAPANTGRDRKINPEAEVDTGRAAPTTERRIATSSVSKIPRQSDAVPPTITASDSAVEVGIAIGHLGAP